MFYNTFREINWHTKEFQIKGVLWHLKVLACSWKGIFHFMKVKALVGQKKLHKKLTCGWQNEDRNFSITRMWSLTMTWCAHIILLDLHSYYYPSIQTFGWQNEDSKNEVRMKTVTRMWSLTMTWSAHIILLSLWL